jgi:hypothetical protein
MYQYNLVAPFEMIVIDIAGSFPRSDKGNLCPPDSYGLFYQLAGSVVVPNQDISTVVEELVTNFFCPFGIPRELHSDQGRNFESRLLQEVLQRLGVSKTHTTPLHPQSDAWWSATIKWSRSIYGRSSHRTRGIGT